MDKSLRWHVDRNVLMSGVGALLCLAAYVVLALVSSGVYFDDDLQHFLISHYSWRHPDLLFDLWGRPAFTILYAPAAALGFTAARLFSALVAAGVCASAGYLAQLYNVRRYWLAVILTGLQPEFARQGFSTLTGLTFALLLCLTLIAYRRKQLRLMALLAGWLPLARYESLPLMLVFALILLRERQWPWLPILGLPLLIQNSFYVIRQQNPVLLLFPISQALGLQGNSPVPEYGVGDWSYYLVRAPVAFGAIIFGLSVYGMLRTRPGVLHASLLITLGTLSLTYAVLPSAAVAGYNRHLAAVAPVAGVLAALGLSDILDRLDQRRTLALAGLALAIAMSLAQAMVQVRPFQLTPMQQAAIEAGEWLRAQNSSQLLLSADPWVAYSAGVDPFDPQSAQPIRPATIAQAPAGSWIVWDSHYAARLNFNTPLELLHSSDRFTLARAWEQPGVQVYVYRRS
jgi:hypothetical protein